MVQHTMVCWKFFIIHIKTSFQLYIILNYTITHYWGPCTLLHTLSYHWMSWIPADPCHKKSGNHLDHLKNVRLWDLNFLYIWRYKIFKKIAYFCNTDKIYQHDIFTAVSPLISPHRFYSFLQFYYLLPRELGKGE